MTVELWNNMLDIALKVVPDPFFEPLLAFIGLKA